MINSMTGFASEQGANTDLTWTLDIRSVNAKGLDIRTRLPEALASHEQTIRGKVSAALHRGSVNVAIKIERSEEQLGQVLEPGVLKAYLSAAEEAQKLAGEVGLTLAQDSATDFLDLRGVMVNQDIDTSIPVDVILDDLDRAISGLVAMRQSEGKALSKVLTRQLDQIANLVGRAKSSSEARQENVARTFKANVEKVLGATDAVDPDRLAQELAIMAVKADVSEELDRLDAHIDAARELLAQDGAVGRKFDFLMQEFNREANTLCSKSGSTELTRVGLDLKAVIDQMREQVQNVE